MEEDVKYNKHVAVHKTEKNIRFCCFLLVEGAFILYITCTFYCCKRLHAQLRLQLKQYMPPTFCLGSLSTELVVGE